MNDCIFCKVVSGEVPSDKIYEDSDFLAFLDINPRGRGHSLIIPKQHTTTLADLPLQKIGKMFEIAQAVAISSVKNLGAQGFNMGANNGALAGQVVPHLHVHIIPRYDEGKDKAYGFEAAFPVREELKAQLKEVASKMKIENITTEAKETKKGKKEKAKWRFLEFSDKPEFEDDKL